MHSCYIGIVSLVLASAPILMHMSLAYLLDRPLPWSLGNPKLKKSAITLHNDLTRSADNPS